MISDILTEGLSKLLPGFGVTVRVFTWAEYLSFKYGTTSLEASDNLYVYVVIQSPMYRIEKGTIQKRHGGVAYRKDVFDSEPLSHWATHIANHFYKDYVREIKHKYCIQNYSFYE